MGAALLDLDQPWRVVARADDYVLAPHETYGLVGDVPITVFPPGSREPISLSRSD